MIDDEFFTMNKFIDNEDLFVYIYEDFVENDPVISAVFLISYFENGIRNNITKLQNHITRNVLMTIPFDKEKFNDCGKQIVNEVHDAILPSVKKARRQGFVGSPLRDKLQPLVATKASEILGKFYENVKCDISVINA